MNVVDDQEAGREENRESGDICELFIGLRGRFDKPVAVSYWNLPHE